MTRCPAAERLERLLDEQLAEPEREAVEAHVESCRACQDALDALAWPTHPPSEARPRYALGAEQLRRLEEALVPPTEPTPLADPLARGDDPEVPGYRVLGELGRGGMGVVLRAVDPTFGRPLAVKVLREDSPPSPELERRFLAEAVLTARLQHPGVPPVHDLGRLADGRPFFAMKVVEGRTLAELLRERTSPEAERAHFLGVFARVCQTLAYAHSRGGDPPRSQAGQRDGGGIW